MLITLGNGGHNLSELYYNVGLLTFSFVDVHNWVHLCFVVFVCLCLFVVIVVVVVNLPLLIGVLRTATVPGKLKPVLIFRTLGLPSLFGCFVLSCF